MRKKKRQGRFGRLGGGGPRGPRPPADRRIEFDGACGPVNPGGVATYGWRLLGPGDRVLAVDSGEVCRGPGATNNVAEWQALVFALRHLAGQGWKGTLQIRGDSLLVINQLNGRWRCRKEHLRPYRDECLRLLAGIHWVAVWVPREENRGADALSRWAALTGPAGG
jgi:ribonuclease HI